MKWTGLREKGGGGNVVLYGISDPGGAWSWVFIITQDPTPPMGGGVQGLWDFARPYPPPSHGQYAATNTSYLEIVEIFQFRPIKS